MCRSLLQSGNKKNRGKKNEQITIMTAQPKNYQAYRCRRVDAIAIILIWGDGRCIHEH